MVAFLKRIGRKSHTKVRSKNLIINVPVVHMARDVMILKRANPFRGPLEGVGPENRDNLEINSNMKSA